MATLVVCVGLSVIAVPLRELTSRDHKSAERSATRAYATDDSEDEGAYRTEGILRLKLLEPMTSLKVLMTSGDLVWEGQDLPVGETEVEVRLRLNDDAVELLVEADFGDLENDSAFFLTVLPDGIEEKTQYVIGNGLVEDVLLYKWDLD